MKTIRFTVYCFNRYLLVDVPNESFQRAEEILERRYREWSNGVDEADGWRCEEFMLNGLIDENIVYIEQKPVLTPERATGVIKRLLDKYGEDRCYHIFGAGLSEPEVFFNVCTVIDDDEAANDVMAWWDT